MNRNRTVKAGHKARSACIASPAPRGAADCRRASRFTIRSALPLLMVAGMLPAAAGSFAASPTPVFSDSADAFDRRLDLDGNGIEDLLDRWLAGEVVFADLRAVAAPPAKTGDDPGSAFPAGKTPAGTVWSRGMVRLVCLGGAGSWQAAVTAGAAAGSVRLIHDLQAWGRVQVLAADEAGLAAILRAGPDGRVFLDRNGTPALDGGRAMVGVPALEAEPWLLGDDWSATVAILDSGCDTAHGDLGDSQDDDTDGPPPVVGDQGDWYPADSTWPLFLGFKVVGWRDVTDDFPLAAGPWDYHHHGTALASVVAGAGAVDPRYRGIAGSGRLTVVKFYDFDEVWHAWAGDFLAACAWTLENGGTYRIRSALCAVNWPEDLGIGDAMSALVAGGILPVVAMGNQGDDPAGPGFPASLPQVLSVGAVNDARAVSAFSGRGNTEGKPDLVAPGGGLLQAQGRITVADNEPDDSYSGRKGTSLAAAHVAGAAFLMDEALRRTGLSLAPGPEAVALRKAVLRLTAAPVTHAETPDGGGLVALPAYAGHDRERGWGLLRVDAAVQALREPLDSSRTQAVTLVAGGSSPVAARRLAVQPGIRYLVEASPAAGLDVSLELVDPRWLQDDPLGLEIDLRDDNGSGVSEFAYLEPDAGGWMFMVVKALSGSGQVVLSLHEAESFSEQGVRVVLPGVLTGGPNQARLAGTAGVSLLVPSRVTVDPVARALNVVDTGGLPRPNWPVFLFPHPSSQGGLTRPLAWDLDGLPGDEIVVSGDFGSVYFFAGNGSYQEFKLTFNRPLTSPVGIEDAQGTRRVVVVDNLGEVRTWTAGGTADRMIALGHGLPLDPAVGILDGSGDEAVVIACRDGTVAALDPRLSPLDGWPVLLGRTLEVPPVLVDLDGDQRHEVVVFAWSSGAAGMVARVLRGDGTPGPGDGSVVPPPGSGTWLAVSPPVVTGAYGAGGVRAEVAGLGSNGQAGADQRWYLGQAGVGSQGEISDRSWLGFEVPAITTESTLTLDEIHFPTPLAYDQQPGGGAELAALLHVRWQDLLYGFTTIPGAVTAWYHPAGAGTALGERQPLGRGGPGSTESGPLGCLTAVTDDRVLMRIQIQGSNLTIQPVGAPVAEALDWSGPRADGRNSGAFPLPGDLSGQPLAVAAGTRLQVFPNPGSGAFSLALDGVETDGAEVSVYDLRGRLVTVLRPAGAGLPWRWDGNDARGRPAAAGAYLAVARQGQRVWNSRILLTR